MEISQKHTTKIKEDKRVCLQAYAKFENIASIQITAKFENILKPKKSQKPKFIKQVIKTLNLFH